MTTLSEAMCWLALAILRAGSKKIRVLKPDGSMFAAVARE